MNTGQKIWDLGGRIVKQKPLNAQFGLKQATQFKSVDHLYESQRIQFWNKISYVKYHIPSQCAIGKRYKCESLAKTKLLSKS